MLETIFLSIVAYIGTNLDDLLMDTLFFTSVQGRRETWQTVLGKFLGIGMLVLISLLGATGLQLLPVTYVRFLGFLPICLALRELYEHFRGTDEEEEISLPKRNLCKGMLLLSIANGSDNIGIYTPLFTAMELWQLLILLAVFALMILLFCGMAKKLSELPLLQKLLLGKKHIIVPMVYTMLGFYILLDI